MTATRNFRIKWRFWIAVFLVCMVLGFVFLFHNSQKHLEQQYFKCELQQDSISQQLRILKEHKYKLEKNLESERAEHLETKSTLEQQIKELKDVHGKNYENLQIKYKALQDQHNILKDDYMRKKNTLLDEIKSLTKESEIWKVKLENMSSENKQLELELLDFKNHCKYKRLNVQTEISDNLNLNIPLVQKSFSKQKLVSDNIYEIKIKKVVGQTSVTPFKKHFSSLPNGRGIINSVENFQIAPQEIQVIQAPPPLNINLTSSSAQINKVSSQSLITKKWSNVSVSPSKKRTIPTDLGVAPVPEIPEDTPNIKDDNTKNNNRYSNIVNELIAKNLGNVEEIDNGAFGHKDLQEVLDDANSDDSNEEIKKTNEHIEEIEDGEIESVRRKRPVLNKKTKNIEKEHIIDDSLNNEVAGDHGKEQQDELRIADEPNNEEEEEDEDGDDYANHEARQKEGQAIRN